MITIRNIYISVNNVGKCLLFLVSVVDSKLELLIKLEQLC